MTRRQEIFAAVKAALQTITVAHGYNNNIALVEDEKLEMPEELNIEQFPAAFIIDTDERKANSDLGDVQCSLDFIVTGYVRHATAAEAARRLFQQDVERAITADRLLGKTYTVDMELTSIKTDKGIMHPYALFDMTFSITYRHEFGTP